MAYKYEPTAVLARAKQTAVSGVSAVIPVQGLTPANIGDCEDIWFFARCWGPGNPDIYSVQLILEESLNGSDWAFVGEMFLVAPSGSNEVNVSRNWFEGKLLDRMRVRWQNLTGAAVEFDLQVCGK